ncbi:hypothetical protein J6590_098940 [Homalodisca vitripennis]|nr:hypothetical protein J6590_098940 [Homalodisca vitripennis]
MCSSMCVYSPVGFRDTSSEDSVFFQRREFFEVMCFGAYTVGPTNRGNSDFISIVCSKCIFRYSTNDQPQTTVGKPS